MKLSVINGPNLNMLGIREPDVYGKVTYADLVSYIEEVCEREGIEVDIFQSNHEGVLVDKIQSCYHNADAILINPAAYTHTSIAILDALKAVDIPTVEVHLSDIYQREAFRHCSYAGMAALKTFYGEGIVGYEKGICYLKEYLAKKNKRRK